MLKFFHEPILTKNYRWVILTQGTKQFWGTYLSTGDICFASLSVLLKSLLFGVKDSSKVETGLGLRR